MTTYHLRTPVTENDIRKLKVNDTVYISGMVVTLRDSAHKRALDFYKQGQTLPVNLKGFAVYHCGPVMKKEPDGSWTAVASGPTTSTRLEAFEADFIELFGPRIIIGKGGMGPRTADAMAKFGAVYCAFTGGAAVLAAKSIQYVNGVEWLDLGKPEAMWIFEFTDFGPLVVAIDSHGSNLYLEISEKARANKESIYKKLEI